MSTQRTWHTRRITTVTVEFGDAHFRLSRIMTIPSALEFAPPRTGDHVLWKTLKATPRIMTTPWVLDSPRCEGCAKTLDLTHSENTLNLALVHPASSYSDMHVSFRCRFCAEAMELTPLENKDHELFSLFCRPSAKLHCSEARDTPVGFGNFR